MSGAAVLLLWFVGCIAAAAIWAVIMTSRRLTEAQCENAALRRQISRCSGSCSLRAAERDAAEANCLPQ